MPRCETCRLRRAVGDLEPHTHPCCRVAGCVGVEIVAYQSYGGTYDELLVVCSVGGLHLTDAVRAVAVRADAVPAGVA